MRKTACHIAIAILSILSFCGVQAREKVSLYYDTGNPQLDFAAGDIISALGKGGCDVKTYSLDKLKKNGGSRIVLSGKTFSGDDGAALGEQAYSIRVYGSRKKTIWVTGGDTDGLMYGGLQLAEDIAFKGLAGVANKQEKPFMLSRGMKLNLPLDRRIPTYVGGWSSNSARKAIPAVWDMDFWKKLIDQQARNRYNLLSVWVHHPFPALVELPDYPEAVLPNIEGFDGYSNDMDISRRIEFWREVMRYAHSRGMKFMFYNWNVYLDYAKEKYPELTNSLDNPHTVKYMNACMKALLETYPELDGFGISAGDGMTNSKEDNNNWTYNAIGKSVGEYLRAHPERKFRLVHRSIYSSPGLFNEVYAPLKDIPNLTLTFSYKYAQAHMYSTTTPNWGNQIQEATAIGLEAWITIRNDDYFYIDWGDPQFVRDYMNGIPCKHNVTGMYIGSDGYNPTVTYSYKNPDLNGILEIQKRWYMEMLWGRISYNPQIEDEVFRNMLHERYPDVSSDDLFEAWTLASRPLPKVTELIMGKWSLDFHWYPEACWSDPRRCSGFRTIDGFADETSVAKGSKLCDIATSASGRTNGRVSSYEVADRMQADASRALSLIDGMKDVGDDTSIAVENIRQMASLAMYYAYKVRGATKKKAGDLAGARNEMGLAYLWWKKYTEIMDKTYHTDSFRNLSINPDWTFGDEAALKEYLDLGGEKIPDSITELTYPYSFKYEGNPLSRIHGAGDPDAVVYGDTLWVYCSQDRIVNPALHAHHYDAMDGYHVFSTTDMENWTDWGEIFSSADVPWSWEKGGFLWAPGAAAKNGKYYLYYPIKDKAGKWMIGAAVGDTPHGPFKDSGKPLEGLSGIDPKVLIDDDGQAYIYCNSAVVAKLKDNMVETAETPRKIIYAPDEVTKVDTLRFNEGSYMHKYRGKYYFSYTNWKNREYQGFYAIGDSPYGPFEWKGPMAPRPAGAQDHHSIVEFKGNWYYFYHIAIPELPKYKESQGRIVCFDRLYYNPDGTIRMVEHTR